MREREEKSLNLSRRWFVYDWVKAGVLLALLVVFVILALRPPTVDARPQPVSTQLVQQTGAPSTTASAPAIAAAPASTLAPAATATLPAAAVASLTPTAATASEVVAATVTAGPTGDCDRALATRLASGIRARVVVGLNVRAKPGVDQTVVVTGLPGDMLEIMGGPMCIPYQDGVYRWWNVQTAKGQVGWLVEGSLYGGDYFLEPVE